VVANRYVTANAGHQGAKIKGRKEREVFFKWLENLEFGVVDLPRPNKTLILHVPAAVAQGLVDGKDCSQRAYAGGKKRDLHEADLDHLKRAEQTYLEIAAQFPKTELLECAPEGVLLSIETIHELIWQRVKKLL
jgi:dTMP kinase